MIQSQESKDWIWFVIYLIIAFVVGIVALKSPLFADWLEDWSSVIGSIVTGFLTIGLLVLYNQQKRLAESEYEPVPWLEGYTTRKNNFNSDDLYMSLSNVGDGTALDLKVKTIIEFPKDKPESVSVKPMTDEIWHLQSGLEDYIWPDQCYLYPNSLKEEFKVNPVIQLVNENSEAARRRVRTLPDYIGDEVDYIEIKLILLYNDQIGNKYDKMLLHEIWPIGPNYTLNQMMVDGVSADENRVYERIDQSINSHRYQQATDETVKNMGFSTILSMYFRDELDEDRFEVMTDEEGGFSFSIQLDNDYREELKNEGIIPDDYEEQISTES